MRYFIVMIKLKSRKEFPHMFVLQATSEEARKLEYRVRVAFETGKIKDFAFEPVVVQDADELDKNLASGGV